MFSKNYNVQLFKVNYLAFRENETIYVWPIYKDLLL